MTIKIDLDQTVGVVRPLQGVNYLGPIGYPVSLNYTEESRRDGIPSARVHDTSCHLGDVVGLRCLFPDPGADHDDPASFPFTWTDDCLGAIREAGLADLFPVGRDDRARAVEAVHRPGAVEVGDDARVCANLLRQYNGCWSRVSNGGIRDREFWREPEGGSYYSPSTRKRWMGTGEGFLDFCRHVPLALKEDPAACVGPAGFTEGGARR